MAARSSSRRRYRLLYGATTLALMAFAVAAALKERNCPRAALRLDSGVTCDYTVLEVLILVITLLTVTCSLVVISVRLALKIRAIASRRPNRDDSG